MALRNTSAEPSFRGTGKGGILPLWNARIFPPESFQSAWHVAYVNSTTTENTSHMRLDARKFWTYVVLVLASAHKHTKKYRLCI